MKFHASSLTKGIVTEKKCRASIHFFAYLYQELDDLNHLLIALYLEDVRKQD